MCHAVGANLLPVTPRLKQALTRTFDSIFTLFQFTVRCKFGCPVLLHRTRHTRHEHYDVRSSAMCLPALVLCKV